MVSNYTEHKQGGCNKSSFVFCGSPVSCIRSALSEQNHYVCLVSDSHRLRAHKEDSILGNWQSRMGQCGCSLLFQQQAFYQTECVCVCVCLTDK